MSSSSNSWHNSTLLYNMSTVKFESGFIVKPDNLVIYVLTIHPHVGEYIHDV